MRNAEIAQILKEMAAYCEMFRLDFKERAYELAAADVKIYPEEIADIYKREGVRALTQMPSVGMGIANHIEELITTGHFREYDEYRKKVPVNLSELLTLSGVGPRTIHELYLRLNVKDVSDLEKACRKHTVRDLPRFGPKSEARILKEIERVKQNYGENH